MATNVPAPLKTADITRFTIRAAQVEKVKPAVAYWCYYYVIDKILKQGLHKTDDQCQNYVVSLMDKAEAMKTEHADEDAFQDEVAAKAYMEQFGLETFMRADNAVRANKASKTTADTFQAAYTFLDVLHVWPPIDQENADKIKYAKYHAVRIAKAIKAGEDPNESNPEPAPEAPVLDANDPEVQAITGVNVGSEAVASAPAQPPASGSQPDVLPSFVDQPPASLPEAPISLPPYPSENSSTATQHMPQHSQAEEFYQSAPHPDVSPLPAADTGGYFPEVPRDSEATSPVLPGAPSGAPGIASPKLGETPPPGVPHIQPPPANSGFQPPPVSAPAFRQPPAQRPPPAAPAAPLQEPVSIAAEVDDAKMTSAQKHARFAISALNFEDVNTAVKELRAALADLGHR